ncbi:MAG: DUF5721 family protein [Acetatifactor sp.]
MLALEITSMKQFMNQLLAADTFDIFLLEEAVISTANTFTIDGHINQEFFYQDGHLPTDSSGNPQEFRPWGEMRGLCFDLIKGKRTPLFFRFVLHLMPEKATALLESRGCDTDPSQVKALVLNIRYDGSKAVLTTGTAFHTFVLSKEPDAIWDKALCRYLDGKGIGYEVL